MVMEYHIFILSKLLKKDVHGTPAGEILHVTQIPLYSEEALQFTRSMSYSGDYKAYCILGIGCCVCIGI
ncbi:hypothetical protein skT53_07790 [Effusibacillus dendaii]|uniref:Uncharacterized protein n=1 Tax=Effusibacillus dendaii TaxID=2743772 RepID=A0A7I8D6S1_9BACL|nr:hypothetical protein skT53_07790 [Effusibacillus dendaii]